MGVAITGALRHSEINAVVQGVVDHDWAGPSRGLFFFCFFQFSLNKFKSIVGALPGKST